MQQEPRPCGPAVCWPGLLPPSVAEAVVVHSRACVYLGRKPQRHPLRPRPNQQWRLSLFSVRPGRTLAASSSSSATASSCRAPFAPRPRPPRPGTDIGRDTSTTTTPSGRTPLRPRSKQLRYPSSFDLRLGRTTFVYSSRSTLALRRHSTPNPCIFHILMLPACESRAFEPDIISFISLISYLACEPCRRAGCI